MIDAQASVRFERQVLLVGVAGQEAIARAPMKVLGEGAAHAIAAMYARAAGATRLEPATIDVAGLAPAELVQHVQAAAMLAGARLALREMVRALETQRV